MDDEFPQDVHNQLVTLVDAFGAIYPDIDMRFGHIVLSDHNWDSVDWAIEHIDDNFSSVAKEHGSVNAGIWRDATLHLLNIIKIVVDEI